MRRDKHLRKVLVKWIKKTLENYFFFATHLSKGRNLKQELNFTKTNHRSAGSREPSYCRYPGGQVKDKKVKGC